MADQGDLNYDRGDMFTNYLKGTHELLLKMPEDITFMARGTWIRDFAATDTTGTLSFNTPESVGSNGLSDDARDDLAFKARLLDLWVSKGFDVGGQRVRARLGNQVINWAKACSWPVASTIPTPTITRPWRARRAAQGGRAAGADAQCRVGPGLGCQRRGLLSIPLEQERIAAGGQLLVHHQRAG
ncbi:hypothetical protein BH77_15880 [Pseudomonas aeruginosa C2773C]|nr:hypothetical protein BH77_15880 [Pseudomonas aeruginosa C2773C]